MQTYTKNHTAMNEMRYRLERNHAKLQSLLDKLNSYRCEPRNHKCFEQLRGIRDDIKRFKKEHSKLHSDLTTKGFGNQESLGEIMRNQIANFKELDQRIGSYLLETGGQ